MAKRLTSPFLSTLIFTWCIANYELVLMAFSSTEWNSKVAYINGVLDDYFVRSIMFWGTEWNRWVSPLLITCLYVFAWPYLDMKIYKYSRKQHHEYKKLQIAADELTPLSDEEAQELRVEIQQAEAKAQVVAFEKEQQINAKDARIQNLENSIKSLTQELESRMTHEQSAELANKVTSLQEAKLKAEGKLTELEVEKAEMESEKAQILKRYEKGKELNEKMVSEALERDEENSKLKHVNQELTLKLENAEVTEAELITDLQKRPTNQEFDSLKQELENSKRLVSKTSSKNFDELKQKYSELEQKRRNFRTEIKQSENIFELKEIVIPKLESEIIDEDSEELIYILRNDEKEAKDFIKKVVLGRDKLPRRITQNNVLMALVEKILEFTCEYTFSYKRRTKAGEKVSFDSADIPKALWMKFSDIYKSFNQQDRVHSGPLFSFGLLENHIIVKNTDVFLFDKKIVRPKPEVVLREWINSYEKVAMEPLGSPISQPL